MMENQADLWIQEVHQDTVGLSFRVEKTLFSGQSRFQRVDLVKTRDHGVMLLNDGIIMLSERDEFCYHEMIAHVPLFVHPEPKKVLIIGGGDGGTAREVLRHPDIERAVMVEIDEMVVAACRKHMPLVSSALDDPRLELRIEDGVKYVAETDERFDIAIVDSTDPIGPAEPLFNAEFYEGIARVLSHDGIFVAQSESPFYDPHLQLPMLKNQRPFFARLHLYLFANLTYPGGLWSFSFASKQYDPLSDFDRKRAEKAGLSLRYYNPGVHQAAFMLPNFVWENLGEALDRPGAPA